MKKVLIIYAHPNTKGFSSETLRQVEFQLKEKDVEYEVIDLYKIGYNPVLQEEEHYTAGNRNISDQNLEFQRKIKEVKNLIFIYPVWWGSMPAILKGFFDRVLTSRFAYKYSKSGVEKLLKEKKAAIFISSGGSLVGYVFLNIPKRIVQHNILGFCGIKSRVFQTYSAHKINAEREKEIEKKVKKGLKYLGLKDF